MTTEIATIGNTGDFPSTAVSETTAIIQVIERAAANPNVDIDKMERLLQMQERIMARNAETAFNEAMGTAQGKIRQVAADSENKQTHSKYASYSALDKKIRPIYTEHGFALSFDTGKDAPADHVRVLCYVSHVAGHTRTYHVDMPADGKGAKGGDVMTKTHAAGAAMQYGMRYLVKLIFNVAIGEDDDGNGAGLQQGISQSQFADFYAAIEALIDRPSGEKLWAKIVNACNAAKDKRSYDELKAKITTKINSLGKVAK